MGLYHVYNHGRSIKFKKKEGQIHLQHQQWQARRNLSNLSQFNLNIPHLSIIVHLQLYHHRCYPGCYPQYQSGHPHFMHHPSGAPPN